MLIFAWLWVISALWGFSGCPTLAVVPLTAVDQQLFKSSQGDGQAVVGELYFERRVPTDWPARTFRPVDLSCDATGQFMAVSDDFQIFAAAEADHAFSPVSCGAVKGEALRDVAVQCNGGDCFVLVLHEKGE